MILFKKGQSFDFESIDFGLLRKLFFRNELKNRWFELIAKSLNLGN